MNDITYHVNSSVPSSDYFHVTAFADLPFLPFPSLPVFFYELAWGCCNVNSYQASWPGDLYYTV